MRVARREVLRLGGGLVAVLSLSRRDVWAEEVVEIRMQGRADGSHVWFDPIGVLIKPGQMVRWTNFIPAIRIRRPPIMRQPSGDRCAFLNRQYPGIRTISCPTRAFQ